MYKKKVRSGFLTALCVLTFLGSCYGVVQAIGLFAMAGEIEREGKQEIKSQEEEQKKNPNEKVGGNPFVQQSQKFFDESKQQANAVLTIVGNLITLVGAIFMFRLNKIGFWIYIGGTLMLILSPILVFGYNTLSSFMSLFALLIGITFVTMYALCLKDMELEEVYD